MTDDEDPDPDGDREPESGQEEETEDEQESLPELRGVFPRDGRWGHRIAFDNYEEGEVYGWITPLFTVGDRFGYQMESGNIGVFEAVVVERCPDPRDMFFADVEAVGYAEDLGYDVQNQDDQTDREDGMPCDLLRRERKDRSPREDSDRDEADGSWWSGQLTSTHAPRVHRLTRVPGLKRVNRSSRSRISLNHRRPGPGRLQRGRPKTYSDMRLIWHNTDE